MEYAKAQIVRSLAGHDRGELFCILDVDGDYLLLADGKRRKTAAPKRKKAKHAQCAGAFGHPALSRLAQGEPVSDSEIRRALAAFRAMEGKTLWQKTI
jgi:ribosomal protein L14E/L6E/L27E